jgi:uncharacterized protein (TIGR02145 family)
MKKSSFRYYFILLLFISAIVSCEENIDSEGHSAAQLNNLSIDAEPALKIKATSSIQLNVNVSPVELTDTAKLTWKSSNPSVATVSATGLLEALKVGTTIISVESPTFNKRATTIVTVEKFVADVIITSIKLNKTDYTFQAINEDILQLEYTYEPANASVTKIQWMSSDRQVVRVSDTGLVSIIGGGSAIVRAQTVDGGEAYAECKITVPGTGIKDALYDSEDDYYKIIYQPVTITVTHPDGTTSTQTWLDRNLGAKQAAQTSNDYAAFGSYFQWGRKADGHEKVIWSKITPPPSYSSETTTEQSPNRRDAGHADFIIFTGDWSSDPEGIENGLWGGLRQTISAANPNYSLMNTSYPLEGANQDNNPCPSGYKVPTPYEVHLMMNAILGVTLQYNAVNTTDDVINKLVNSELHFAAAGNRANTTGAFSNVNSYVFLWTNTPNSANNSFRFQATNSSAGVRLSAIQKANAYPIRCINAE